MFVCYSHKNNILTILTRAKVCTAQYSFHFYTHLDNVVCDNLVYVAWQKDTVHIPRHVCEIILFYKMLTRDVINGEAY